MKRRGTLAYVMIVLIALIGVVNFFAQFFTDYHSDPIVTYIFMGVASGIAGYKGVGAAFLQRYTSTKEPTEEKE